MVGLINLAAGLSAAGGAVSKFADMAGLEQMKANLETQKLQLADSLAGARAWNAPGVAESVASGKIGLSLKQGQNDAFNRLMGRAPAPAADGTPQSAPTDAPPAANAMPAASDAAAGAAPIPGSSQSQPSTAQQAPALPQGFDAIPAHVKTQMDNAYALGGPEAGLKIYSDWAKEQNTIFDQRQGSRLIAGSGNPVGDPNLKTITPFTDEDRQKFGLSPEDQGGIDENGKPFVLADTAAKIRMRQAPELARAAQENFTPPTMIGYTGPDGEEVQKAAIYDKKKGQYFDVATLRPIQSPQNLRVIGNSTTSARSQAAISRILTNAEDATSGIENLSNISSAATGGLYRNLETTPLSALTRLVTPQEVQDTQATIAGLSRAMGGLATGGLAVDDNVMKSYEGLNLNTGDSYLTKMRKLAEMRQQSTNALDVQSVSPILSNDQRKKAAELSDRIKTAIPWTVADVQKLENSQSPNASLRDLSMQKLNRPTTATGGKYGAAPPGIPQEHWNISTPEERAAYGR